MTLSAKKVLLGGSMIDDRANCQRQYASDSDNDICADKNDTDIGKMHCQYRDLPVILILIRTVMATGKVTTRVTQWESMMTVVTKKILYFRILIKRF